MNRYSKISLLIFGLIVVPVTVVALFTYNAGTKQDIKQNVSVPNEVSDTPVAQTEPTTTADSAPASTPAKSQPKVAPVATPVTTMTPTPTTPALVKPAVSPPVTGGDSSENQYERNDD